MKLIFVLFIVTVLFNYAISSDVENAFIENGIVQDISIVAPKKIVNVSFFLKISESCEYL